ncbi:MAG: molybdopterin-guanine dinucleotide biosynthesis protein B [Candidatus Scalindua sp.]|jgi:molybdopterin-guanine dinucleotide biosynthesis protein B|nr:molybdopterin-guanine dinucleotide biosynthesis protein B [Candidatus Scalindua sp.]MDV5166889.1 molybdopterin-guanine dinucleotide biosynthesis protein B [Candidatus Scalindua sp.]
MSSKDVTIISIAGKQNAGKTTLLKGLIPKLKEQGYRVGTLKYNIRKFDIDHEDKDTYKYSNSGADSVAISTQSEFVVMKKTSNPLTLHEIIEAHFNDVDVVLVEGYREDGYPRIRIVDPQDTNAVKTGSKNELLLVNVKTENSCFSIDGINKAMNFIEKALKII